MCPIFPSAIHLTLGLHWGSRASSWRRTGWQRFWKGVDWGLPPIEPWAADGIGASGYGCSMTFPYGGVGQRQRPWAEQVTRCFKLGERLLGWEVRLRVWATWNSPPCLFTS